MHRTFLFAVLAALPLAAAPLDRRSRDEPEMFVDAGGRTGTCDALLFSPDGKRLLAGGDDKVVRVWAVGDKALETARMTTLRWPAWREQRGGVKTIAVPADAADRRTLIGGFGLKTGLVVLLDADGKITATNEIDGQTLPTHTTMASAFAPDGKSAVYATADGRVWHWDFAQSNKQLFAFPAGERGFNRPRLIRFLDANTFIGIAEAGQVVRVKRQGDAWSAEALFTLQGELGAALAAQNEAVPQGKLSIYRADLSPDGRWLAASLQPNHLLVCSLDGKVSKSMRIDTVVRSLAFDSTNRLAIGVAGLSKQGNFRLDTNDRITVLDPPEAGKPLTSAFSFDHPGRAEALAWGRDGKLAIAGGDNHEVTLHDLRDKSNLAPLTVVRGRGRGLWDVRVGKDGETVAFRAARNEKSASPNERGTGDWQAFNFAVGKPVAATNTVPLRTTADGWTVEASGTDPMTWFAVHAESQVRHALTLDPDRDEQPRCWCFIPASGKKPTRLLVGHYYGYSQFDLTKDAALRTALGTGQAGDIHSIAADAAGKWFVTCGADQTIAGWSLDDWEHGAIGAAFKTDSGKLMVDAVDIGGPAWEMGLAAGDEIVLAVRGGKELLFGRAGDYASAKLKQDTGSVDAASKALASAASGSEIYLGWKRGGKGDVVENLSTLRRRPLWRFFPAFDDHGKFEHWIVWLWKGGHYATSTHGDSLVGWQLNDPTTIHRAAPDFFLANRFKNVLHKKVAVLRLMQSRDLVATLKDLTGDNPQPPKFGLMEPAPVALTAAELAPPAGLDVKVDVRPRGTNPDLLPERVELWVNDHRYKTWAAGGKAVDTTATIPQAVFRRGENQVTVLTFNAAGGRGEAKHVVGCDRSDRKPRLLGLFVGVNDYSQVAANPDGSRDFGNLLSAINDANKLGAAWKGQVGNGKQYTEERVVVALDAQAKREDILKALDALAAEATADDRVVVFLAGHGDFVTKAKGSDDKVFVFCAPNYSRANWQKTGVSATELFDRLAGCPARKLVLLDACHSGQAASESVVRELAPEGQGPLVIAACDQKEQSFEHPKLGHGLFTAAALEALGTQFASADTSKDNVLDAQELFDFIRGRLPALLKETGKPAGSQNPQSFPVDLPRTPLARR